jgi:hypothetical protein
VHHAVGVRALEVGKRQVAEIVGVAQHRGAFIVDVEKRLQVAEVVRRAQRLDRRIAQPHAVLLRQRE